MSQFQNILIVGATGQAANLGEQIAHSFLHNKKSVRILVRSESLKDSKK